MTDFVIANYFEYEGYIVNEVYAPMPRRQHGAIVPNEDGSFTTFIDPNDSYEMQMEGILHELDEHIKHRQFDNIEDKNADQLEADAHGIVTHVETAESEPVRKKIKWEFTAFDLHVLRKYECVREHFGLTLEDLPEEPLWPPKNYVKGKNIPREYRTNMTRTQLVTLYYELGMYDKVEEIVNREMGRWYAQIIKEHMEKNAK